MRRFALFACDASLRLLARHIDTVHACSHWGAGGGGVALPTWTLWPREKPLLLPRIELWSSSS
jgi:hypothetical protein